MASSKKPTKKTLPLYCIYDEFGLSSIPNMLNYANTVRSYKVSISILMQNINQLTFRYGTTEGKIVLGAFSTKANFT
jgi:type IV secretory pathway TraG/TraD family ATPase VirD4